jgi:hypothetical protein
VEISFRWMLPGTWLVATRLTKKEEAMQICYRIPRGKEKSISLFLVRLTLTWRAQPRGFSLAQTPSPAFARPPSIRVKLPKPEGRRSTGRALGP